jgi:hypothetical protein
MCIPTMGRINLVYILAWLILRWNRRERFYSRGKVNLKKRGRLFFIVVNFYNAGVVTHDRRIGSCFSQVLHTLGNDTSYTEHTCNVKKYLCIPVQNFLPRFKISHPGSKFPTQVQNFLSIYKISYLLTKISYLVTKFPTQIQTFRPWYKILYLPT